jgi:hypothetical protein
MKIILRNTTVNLKDKEVKASFSLVKASKALF